VLKKTERSGFLLEKVNFLQESMMSAPNPYSILGVSPKASFEEIKVAYRKLAKQYHPDLNPGKPEIEKKFKDINAAYDLLSDSQKKERFDRGEIDASGQDVPFGGRHYGSSSSNPFKGGGDFNIEEIFEELLNKRPRSRKGGTVTQTLDLNFIEAAIGCQKRLTKSDHKSFDVNIPAGVSHGQTLRLKGQGQPGTRGGEAGDLMLEIHVAEHPYFKRENNDIYLNLPITLDEAILGAKVEIPTIHGPIQLTLPKGSNTDTKLRLKGKGIHKKGTVPGDQYIILKIMLPQKDSSELETFFKSWAKSHSYSVRSHFKA
jgi:DnaJ-class molecular chaperone